MDIIIREAVQADLPRLLELYSHISTGEDLPAENARDIFNRIKLLDGYNLFVAEREGTVVGTFTLFIMIEGKFL